MILRKLIFSLLFVGVVLKLSAQDASFSQYYASELYLNPALAGEERYLTFTSNFRQQWKSIVLPYTSTQLSVVLPIFDNSAAESHKGGVGLSVYNDKAGDSNFNNTSVNLTGAYNLPLTLDYTHNVSFGVQFGFTQKSFDNSNLEWGEQYNSLVGFDSSIDPNEDQISSTVFFPSISAGLVYYYNYQQEYTERKVSAYVGGSVYHINEPNESFAEGVESPLPRLFKAHGGVNIPVGEKFYVSPSALYVYQLENDLVNAGLYLSYQAFGESKSILSEAEIMLGSWFRLQDSFIFSAGIHQKSWTLGLSYDYNNSSLRRQTRGRGAYEISLRIRLVKERHIKKIATPRI